MLNPWTIITVIYCLCALISFGASGFFLFNAIRDRDWALLIVTVGFAAACVLSIFAAWCATWTMFRDIPL